MPPGRGKVLIFVAIMLAWAVIMVAFFVLAVQLFFSPTAAHEAALVASRRYVGARKEPEVVVNAVRAEIRSV